VQLAPVKQPPMPAERAVNVYQNAPLWPAYNAAAKRPTVQHQRKF
jgi:hypothetical protein